MPLIGRSYLGLSQIDCRHFGTHSIIIVIVLVCHVFLPLPSAASSVATQQTLTLEFSTETNEIDGSGIINTPNENSSSYYHNIPYLKLADNEAQLSIGSLCEKDSNCGNFSVCRLIMSDDTTTIKICDCDDKEMKQVNQSCYMKPGHQCYFPNKNSHGYSFIQCLPGSVCTSAVNVSSPQSGYCMCKTPPIADHYRAVDVDFEMGTCSSSTFSSQLPFLSAVIFATRVLCNVLGGEAAI